VSGRLSISGVREVLRNRDFTLFTVGAFFSHTGDWAQRLAIGWITWELTRSPAWLGIILFADLAPTLVLSPIGGAVADRYDRLWLARVTLWCALAHPVVLAALYFTGLLNIWLLLLAAVYHGVASAFGQSARLAMTALIVSERDISRAMPIGSISFNMARFAGPALFGLIVVVASPGYAIAFNAAMYLVFAVILHFVHLRDEPIDESRDRHLLVESLHGIRYALTHPGIGPLLVVLVVSSLGSRAFLDLLPGFADEVFGRGPEALSIMTSATALGALAGGIYLLLRASIAGLAGISMAWSMLIGVGLIAFTMTDAFWLAVPILFFVGCGLSISATGVLTLAQSSVRGEMRGRVLSTYGIIFRGGPALGGLLMGWIAEWTGLRWPVAGGGLLCVLIWLWVVGKLPRLRRVLEVEGPDRALPLEDRT